MTAGDYAAEREPAPGVSIRAGVWKFNKNYRGPLAHRRDSGGPSTVSARGESICMPESVP
jgi:hypothetical protein